MININIASNKELKLARFINFINFNECHKIFVTVK